MWVIMTRIKKFHGYRANTGEIEIVISEDDGTTGYIMNIWQNKKHVGVLEIYKLDLVKDMIWMLVGSLKQLKSVTGKKYDRKLLKEFLLEEAERM